MSLGDGVIEIVAHVTTLVFIEAFAVADIEVKQWHAIHPFLTAVAIAGLGRLSPHRVEATSECPSDKGMRG